MSSVSGGSVIWQDKTKEYARRLYAQRVKEVLFFAAIVAVLVVVGTRCKVVGVQALSAFFAIAVGIVGVMFIFRTVLFGLMVRHRSVVLTDGGIRVGGRVLHWKDIIKVRKVFARQDGGFWRLFWSQHARNRRVHARLGALQSPGSYPRDATPLEATYTITTKEQTVCVGVYDEEGFDRLLGQYRKRIKENLQRMLESQ